MDTHWRRPVRRNVLPNLDLNTSTWLHSSMCILLAINHYYIILYNSSSFSLLFNAFLIRQTASISLIPKAWEFFRHGIFQLVTCYRAHYIFLQHSLWIYLLESLSSFICWTRINCYKCCYCISCLCLLHSTRWREWIIVLAIIILFPGTQNSSTGVFHIVVLGSSTIMYVAFRDSVSLDFYLYVTGKVLQRN